MKAALLSAVLFAASEAQKATWVKCDEWNCEADGYEWVDFQGNVASDKVYEKRCIGGEGDGGSAAAAGWYSKRKGTLHIGNPPSASSVALDVFCQSEGFATVGQIWHATPDGSFMANNDDSYCNAKFEYLGGWNPKTDLFHSGYNDITFQCVDVDEFKVAPCCYQDSWTGDCHLKRSEANKWQSCIWGTATNRDEPNWMSNCKNSCGNLNGDLRQGGVASPNHVDTEACWSCCTNHASMAGWNCAAMTTDPTAAPVVAMNPTMGPTITMDLTAAPVVTMNPTMGPTITMDPTAAPSMTMNPTMAPVTTMDPTASPTTQQVCKEVKVLATCEALDHCRPKSRKGKLKKCKDKKCRKLKSPTLCNLVPKCTIIEKRGTFKKCDERRGRE